MITAIRAIIVSKTPFLLLPSNLI